MISSQFFTRKRSGWEKSELRFHGFSRRIQVIPLLTRSSALWRASSMRSVISSWWHNRDFGSVSTLLWFAKNIWSFRIFGKCFWVHLMVSSRWWISLRAVIHERLFPCFSRISMHISVPGRGIQSESWCASQNFWSRSRSISAHSRFSQSNRIKSSRVKFRKNPRDWSFWIISICDAASVSSISSPMCVCFDQSSAVSDMIILW